MAGRERTTIFDNWSLGGRKDLELKMKLKLKLELLMLLGRRPFYSSLLGLRKTNLTKTKKKALALVKQSQQNRFKRKNKFVFSLKKLKLLFFNNLNTRVFQRSKKK